MGSHFCLPTEPFCAWHRASIIQTILITNREISDRLYPDAVSPNDKKEDPKFTYN